MGRQSVLTQLSITGVHFASGPSSSETLNQATSTETPLREQPAALDNEAWSGPVCVGTTVSPWLGLGTG